MLRCVFVIFLICLQEIKKILRSLAGLKIVGADIVEVAPAYDTQGMLIF